MKTKNIQPLGLFIKEGKIGEVFYTDRKTSHVHSLCQYYKRTAICESIKAIEADKVINLTKIVLTE